MSHLKLAFIVPAIAVGIAHALALSGCSQPAQEQAAQELREQQRPERQQPEQPRTRLGAQGAGTEGSGAQGPRREGPPGPGMRLLREGSVPVAVVEAARGDVDAVYSATATLSAVEEAVVVARTQGIVESIAVEESDPVVAGQALAQLDTRRLRLELERTRASLENLERNFERAERIFAQQMMPAEAFDRARFDLETARATYELQRHELTEATLRAPFDGVVSLRHVKVGNTLQPGNPAFDITRTSELEAILGVPERELPKMALDHPAEIRADAVPGESFPGKITRIAPVVDPRTGTFRVTVGVDNARGRLKPGMFARVETRYDRREGVLLIPREAIVSRDGRSEVFVVREDRAVRAAVATGYSSQGRIEVREGLEPGDLVVVTGQNSLRDGVPVRVVMR